GAMAALAPVAVVVGAAGGNIAVGGHKGLGSEALEVGVGLAGGADHAGAYVAPFFAASSPVWWAQAAMSRPRSPRSCSICPKAWFSDRSAKRSAICRSLGSAPARRASRRARTRASRSRAVCEEAGLGASNMLTFLVLRQGAVSDFSSPAHLNKPARIFHHFP